MDRDRFSWNSLDDEEDSKSDAPSEPKKPVSLPGLFRAQSGPDFFRKQMAAFEKPKEDDKEDVSDTASSTKTRPLGKRLGAAVGSVLGAPEASSAQSANEQSPDQLLADSQTELPNETSKPLEVSDQNIEPQEDLGEVTTEDSAELTGAEGLNEDDDDITPPPKTAPASQLQPAASPTASKPSASKAGAGSGRVPPIPPPLPPSLTPSNNPNLPPTPVIHNNFNTLGATPQTTNPNAVGNTTKIIDRRSAGGALLAFLAADYLSRRRDRKLSGRIKEQEKTARERMDQIKRDQLSQQEAQARLMEHQKQQVAKLEKRQKDMEIPTVETPRADIVMAETVPTVVEKQKGAAPLIIEKQRDIMASERDLDGAIIEKQVTMNTLEHPVSIGTELKRKYSEELRQSKKAEETTKVTAESYVASESYEKIRKDRDKRRGAASGRQFAQYGSPYDIPSGVNSSAGMPAPVPNIGNSSPEKVTGSSYKQSITLGVVSALVVLVLVVMAYALSR